MFGVLIRKEGHDGYFAIIRYKLTIDNINKMLDYYAPYRLPGDIDEAYDFLTNPQRKDDNNLYLGQTESYLGSDEEYYFVREERLGGNDGSEKASSYGSNMYGSRN